MTSKLLAFVLLLSSFGMAQGVAGDPGVGEYVASGGGGGFTRQGAAKVSVMAFGDNTVTLNATPASGDLVVCSVNSLNWSPTGAGIKDSSTNSFALAAQANNSSNAEVTQVYYIVAGAGLTANITIHVEWAGGASRSICQVYRGSNAVPLDQTATATINLTTDPQTFSSGTSATVASGALLTGWLSCNNSGAPPPTWTAGTGWTKQGEYTASGPYSMFEDQLNVSAATYQADASYTTGVGAKCAAVFVSFKP